MGKKTTEGTKAPAKASKADDKKSRRRRVETFSSYIYKVLKQDNPAIRISKKAMNILNTIIHATFDHIRSDRS